MDFYKEKNVEGNKIKVVVEGDGHSVWAYYIKNGQIELDGFVCSQGTVVKTQAEVKKYLENNFSPPLTEEFSNQNSVQTRLDENEIDIQFNDIGAQILINGDLFVVMDFENRVSMSKSLSKAGPFGKPLTC